MKTALIILAVIQAISGTITALVTFSQSVLLGILAIVLVVLALVPIVVLIRLLEAAEDQQVKLHWLTERVYKLEKQLAMTEQPIMTDEQSIGNSYENHLKRPRPQKSGVVSAYRWVCPKCQSVNPEGTASCQECGAHYSLEIGMMEDRPLTKWKLKDYKKKKRQ